VNPQQSPAGLAAQPVPLGPRRGRTGVSVGRAARQRQRRRSRAEHHLAVAAQGVHPPRPRHAGPQRRGGPPARHRSRPPAHRPTGHPRSGPGVRGAQPWRSPSPPTVTGRAVPVGPSRRAVRHLGRQGGGRAVQRKPRPQAHHPRLGDHPTGCAGADLHLRRGRDKRTTTHNHSCQLPIRADTGCWNPTDDPCR
jgi:hypothetical protein